MTRQLRYEGPRLEELLDHIRQTHGSDARIVAADRVRTGGFAGFFPKESFEVIVELDEEPAATPHPAGATADASAGAVPVPSATTDRRPPPPDFAAVLASMVDDDDPPAPSTDFLASGSGPVDLTGPFEVTHPLDAADDAPVELDDLFEHLDHRVDRLPTLPGQGIVMVVGARDEAVRTACALAASVGLAQRDVLIAGPGRSRALRAEVVASVITESARRADRRSARPGPRLVVLELQPGLAGHRWAADVVRSVDPAQVRMAIAGWRLADQEVRTVRALRRLDAIDLVDLEAAVAPEQYLDLGVPVATLDGQPATAEAWTALLVSVGRADTILGDPDAEATPTRSATAPPTATGSVPAAVVLPG